MVAVDKTLEADTTLVNSRGEELGEVVGFPQMNRADPIIKRPFLITPPSAPFVFDAA